MRDDFDEWAKHARRKVSKAESAGGIDREAFFYPRGLWLSSDYDAVDLEEAERWARQRLETDLRRVDARAEFAVQRIDPMKIVDDKPGYPMLGIGHCAYGTLVIRQMVDLPLTIVEDQT